MRPARAAFSDAELETINRVSSEMGFEVMFTPAVSHDEVFPRLTAPDADAFVASYPLRINAPTDKTAEVVQEVSKGASSQ